MTESSNDIQYARPTLRPVAGLAAMQFIFNVFALLVAATLTTIPFIVTAISNDSILFSSRIACIVLSIIALILRESKIILSLAIYAGITDLVAAPASALASTHGGPLSILFCLAWAIWGIFTLAASVCGFHRLERLHGE